MKALLLSLKFLIVVSVLLCSFTSTTKAQSIVIDHVDGALDDTTLIAGQTHRIHLRFDLSGLPFSEGGMNSGYVTRNQWLLWSPDGADWGYVIGTRGWMLLRQILEGGPYDFSGTPLNWLWHAEAGTGDVVFDNPSASIREQTGQIFAGPAPGNITGADSVALLVGTGWDVGFASPQSEIAYIIEFTSNESDIGKHICIDSFLVPNYIWDWVRIGDYPFKPNWDGPYCFVIGSCCQGTVGDANMSGDATVGDISVIVNMLFGSGEPVACFAEADANLSAYHAGHIATIFDITVGDMAEIIDKLYGSGVGMQDCPY